MAQLHSDQDALVDKKICLSCGQYALLGMSCMFNCRPTSRDKIRALRATSVPPA